MRRRYRRRRKSIFRPKSQTVFSSVALLLIAAAVLSLLSFSQNGTVLSRINMQLDSFLGVAKYLFPFILLITSAMIIGFKNPLSRPNITIGSALIFICLMTLLQSGSLGFYIWLNVSNAVSEIGGFILISLMLFIGLIVLFNTSLSDLAKFAQNIWKSLDDLKGTLPQSKNRDFVAKLPIKAPTFSQVVKDAGKRNETKNESLTGKDKGAAITNDLGTGLVQNLNGQTQVWEYPPLSLLSAASGQKADRGDMKYNAETIEKTLESFGISAKVVEVNLGPAVTQYAIDIAIGTKLSKITALSNDLALALAAPTGQIRIDAPIPGRKLVGIEIPNRSLEYVTLKHMLQHDIMKKSKEKLLVALGLDVSGNPVVTDISKMPHILIAGTTGSGKSVLINTLITSLLYRNSPSEVKLILVDPKRVELSAYKDIPHLLTPVIIEPNKILSALKWASGEMDRRYKLFAEVGVRNIDGYNELSGFQAIPYIVIVIDELSALMQFAPVDVEDAICHLAQMARATGIHLVVATQRPSVNVITGLIKANIPSRIAFNVSSMMDSRVIIDLPGAEKLLGRGDMLYIPPDQAKPTRIQGTFVTSAEVTRLVEYLKSKNVPVQYTEEVTTQQVSWKKGGAGTLQTEDGHDPLFTEAIRVVCQYDRASASLLQRRLSVGYARAAKILDQMEAAGVVGMAEGSKPREVLVKNPDEFFQQLAAPQETV